MFGSFVSTWLKVPREPDVASILLEQGPSVLGWKRAGAIEETAILESLVIMFQKAQRSGKINIISVITVLIYLTLFVWSLHSLILIFGTPVSLKLKDN